MSTPRLQLSGITKRYPSVVANSAVSLTVMPGQTHAVLGENGAGKSTLMKIIYGSVKPDEGTVLFNGQVAHIQNPQEARALGISMVFQHFSLFDTITVAENVWLGLDKSLSLAQVTQSIVTKATEYGLDIDPARPVHTLSVGEMQRVEIIRALLTNPQLLILDEPTSVLTPQAVEKLFVVLKKLASEGCSILYISHKLHEIRELCNACTVLRGGKVTGVCDPSQESNASLSKLMIGAEPPQLTHRPQKAGAPVLAVSNLILPREDQFGVDIEGISLQVCAGEVVGIAGVSGNGQKELLCALSGEDVRAKPGTIRMINTDVSRLHPGQRRKLGLHFVPEERLGRGAVPTLSLAQNLLLTRQESIAYPQWGGGWIQVKSLERHAADIIARFQVKAGGPRSLARSLSGGNLQKFIVGREMDANPKLFIVSQPTWGVDVGASAQIRGEILALRDAGCAVLVVSEELDELFEVSDRLHVISRGQLSPSIPVAEATIEKIGEWMSGLWSNEVQEHLAEMEQASATSTDTQGGQHVQA
ncbi:galactose/methyl galactoside import ATP-binding protein MglA [Rhodoferax lithotrophicus]|uniref:Galactose/methyl galactoside import ATP-binding protein MglA n=1 Tax=Rhodoferax lithotrophicus TaxID=2798804 RepID=A0ABM7MJN1_9BURK|nr:ABC transporter ATP-binding protein [Rhodoferax sp. MIZ03]BCO26389.1 galactose/methyl galactoside import ATP-binding protein MglA [Rhodoferax sp. MIZ03]